MQLKLLNQKYPLSEIWKLRKPMFRVITNPKKMSNFLIANLSEKLKLTKPFGLPFILMVEPSSICNLNCPMCPMVLNSTKREKKGHMDFNVFKKVIDEIGDYLIAITLWNYGEPLLNPDFSKIVAYAKKKDIITIVSTNGMLMTDTLNRRLIESGLDYLILSLDGATKKTYEKYRGKNANYEKTISNLKSLIRIKKEMKKNNPFVNLQFIVMKENEHEIPLIKSFSSTIGVDKLSLKKIVFAGSDLNKFLPKEKKHIFGGHKEGTKIYNCARLWHSSLVSWNGIILPCCGDFDFQYNLGNIADESFKKIWKSQRYTELRKQVLKNINAIKMCRTCPSANFSCDMFIE